MYFVRLTDLLQTRILDSGIHNKFFEKLVNNKVPNSVLNYKKHYEIPFVSVKRIYVAVNKLSLEKLRTVIQS